jgi:hypothetical protein
MIDIPPYALWLFLPPIIGGGIWYFARISRDKHTADVAARKAEQDAVVADAKRRDADTAKWRSGFREIVIHLRTEMCRGESPSDWFPTFDTSIPILNRVASTMPSSMDSTKRAEIISIVDQITAMSTGQGEQAVYGAQKVVDMLCRLEELTRDT